MAVLPKIPFRGIYVVQPIAFQVTDPQGIREISFDEGVIKPGIGVKNWFSAVVIS